MPRTKKTVVQETTEHVEITSPDDSPKVIAYRVGQVEQTMNKGFEKLHNKLEELKDGFVSHEEMAKLIQESTKIHEDHENRIRSLETSRNKGLGALATWQQLLVLLGVVAAIIGALWWIKA